MRDGDAFVPTSMAKGPWGSSISGNFIGGILGYGIEREAADRERQPARLTVDLVRPAAMEPLRVRASTVRQGRRLTLVDGEITQSDTVVARASAVFLRKGEQPPGTIWTSPVTMPPMPPDADAAFVRSAMAGDVASSLTHYGTEGLTFINADYTLTLSRLPEGPDLGLAALTHSSHEGVGTGTAVMFDHRGPIGTATATTLANPGFRPRSIG